MSPHTAEVAIIGAGTAGCFIASLLDNAGVDCIVIEKSRGLGGRCSRRRVGSDYDIDLGSPEFSPSKISNPLLKEMLNTWVAAGYLSAWCKDSSRFDTPTISRIETLCGTPSMSTWHKKIASNINTLTQRKVSRIKRVDTHWHLLNENHQLIAVTKKVVITSPPEQAIDLLNTVENFHYSQGLPTESLPQYVCAVSFSKPINMAADVYENGHSLLRMAIRENSKPGRTFPASLKEVWVLHSTHNWAQEQRHADSDTCATLLADTFCEHFDIDSEPRILTSHYWRMSKHKKTSQESTNFIWDSTLKVGCCGDWLAGGGTLGALNSALDLHQKILTQS
jgi:renalase